MQLNPQKHSKGENLMKKIGILSVFLALLTTACTITAVTPITAVDSISDSSWVMGDTDGDGLITIMDATVIQRYLARYTIKNEERVKACGDLNHNGLDIMDATAIQRYLAHYSIQNEIDVPYTAPTEAAHSGDHTVVFKDSDGNVLSTQTIPDGEAAVAPENPEREGYIFTGWSTSFDSVTGDIEIVAMFSEIGTSPTFVIDRVYARPGDKKVAVTVKVVNNPGVASIALDILYDTTRLTLTDFEYNTGALAGASTTPFNADAYQPCLFMVNGTKNIEGDFLFATMYFDVADNASGTCPITLVYDEDNVYNIDEDNIPFDVDNGFISAA
jgi:hypothetical protein